LHYSTALFNFTAVEDDFLIMIGHDVGEILKYLLKVQAEYLLGENKENIS
jgi:hypothetical protein